MKRSTLVIAGACIAAAALIAASRQPARTDGSYRSALDGMVSTEMSLVRRETASVGEFQSAGGSKGPTTIQASIVRATSDRLVTSKYAYAVSLSIGGYALTLDVAQAQRLIETIDRIEAARAQPPAEPFAAATVTFKDSSGVSFFANTGSGGSSVSVQLHDTAATVESLTPLRELLAEAVKRISEIRAKP